MPSADRVERAKLFTYAAADALGVVDYRLFVLYAYGRAAYLHTGLAAAAFIMIAFKGRQALDRF